VPTTNIVSQPTANLADGPTRIAFICRQLLEPAIASAVGQCHVAAECDSGINFQLMRS
jgi:hypothetical protein